MRPEPSGLNQTDHGLAGIRFTTNYVVMLSYLMCPPVTSNTKFYSHGGGLMEQLSKTNLYIRVLPFCFFTAQSDSALTLQMHPSEYG
uniref:Uncharacterized protein n=1 Tax=Labrus bergylta TaxID=56723 RepID=A0A3Q3EN16_9LABR